MNPNPKAIDDGLARDAKHHLGEDDFAEQDHHELQAGMSKHHCTDIMCGIIFLVALAGLGILVNYGRVEGDLRRLTHGYNFTGHLCGVDDPGKPYLYWCQKPGRLAGGSAPISLDLRHPICVQRCPTGFETKHVCFEKAEKVVHRHTGTGDKDKDEFFYEETNRYVFAKVNDYASKPYLDRYCLPEDAALMAQLMQALNQHGMTKLLMEFSQLQSAWIPLASSLVIATVLGYVYLFMIDKMATCFFWMSICLVVILSGVSGLYFLISEFTGGTDGIPNSGDSTFNLFAGFVLLIVAGGFSCFAVCSHDKIEVAIGCVQTAADCMFDMPTLLFEPLITVLVKAVLGVLLMAGFLLLASAGKVKTLTLEQFVTTYESIPGSEVSGVFRTFQYHEGQRWCMVFYIFVSIWIMSLVTALSQFVLAYSVQLWYFTPILHDHKDAPSFPLFRGYYIGLCYHMGSLAFGGLVVTMFSVVRLTLGTLAAASEHEGHPVLAIIAKCLFCCVECYQRFVEFLNKNAYMDIAINSTTFCTAAQNALQVIAREMEAIAFLNGATFVFKITGYALITASGTFIVWTMVRSMWCFNNVASSWYIHDPIVVCALAGVICFIIAMGFMIVFDMVADTVLYCFATEERRKQRHLLPKDAQYAPSSLNRLIDHHSDYPQSPSSTSHAIVDEDS
jgi:hypothetical protein